MGINISSSGNTQIGNSNLVQSFAGTCNITCDNKMVGGGATVINSYVAGDVEVTQTCAVNGQCSFNVAQSSLADLTFKTNLSAVSSPSLGNFDFSSNRSYQQINQYINNQILQKCDITSINEMNNVELYVANSQIGGSVKIGQANSATGSCAMQDVMSAHALASGSDNQCASAGKKGKKSCGGKSQKSIGSFLIYGAAAVVIFVIIMMVYRYFSNKKLPDCKPGMKPGTCTPPTSLPPTNQGGYVDNGGYGDQGQGYVDQGQGYVDQGQGYGDQGQGYVDQGQGYVDEGQGYGDQGQGYVDQGQGYGDNEGLQMTPSYQAQDIDPLYLEALGEN